MIAHPNRRPRTGDLTHADALRAAARIEAGKQFWCTLYAHNSWGTVLEVRARTRPYPLVKRCLTTWDVAPFLADPAVANPAALANATSLADWMRLAKAAGISGRKATALAREHGWRCESRRFRLMWKGA